MCTYTINIKLICSKKKLKGGGDRHVAPSHKSAPARTGRTGFRSTEGDWCRTILRTSRFVTRRKRWSLCFHCLVSRERFEDLITRQRPTIPLSTSFFVFG